MTRGKEKTITIQRLSAFHISVVPIVTTMAVVKLKNHRCPALVVLQQKCECLEKQIHHMIRSVREEEIIPE